MTPCATSSTSPTWSGTPRWCGSGRSPPASRPPCWRRSSTSIRAEASRTASRCAWSRPAEASGELRPGGTIVEPTSGNTGVGLAIVAQRKGYGACSSARTRSGEDKRNVLKAYGAEVVVCPTAVDPDHPDSYYRTSDRLVEEIDGAWKPNQYANPENPQSHYLGTGPELWEQTDGRITHFVAGHRHRRHDQRHRPLPQGGLRRPGAGDRCRPEGSVYSGGTGGPTSSRGRGGLLADHLRQGHLRPDRRGLRRRLVRHDPAAGARGGAAGRRSCGMATVAALQVAAELRRRGPRRRRGRAAARRRPGLPRQGVQRRVDGRLRLPAARPGHDGRRRAAPQGRLDPALVHAHPNETVADAVHYLREFAVSQMPWCAPSRR
jgi:cystathionine beta-synthase